MPKSDLTETQTFLQKAQEDILDAVDTCSSRDEPLLAKALVSVRQAMRALREIK